MRIISGHNALFHFKCKIDPDINPVCRFCLEADECFFHLINDCPRFNNGRRDIFLDKPVCNDMEWKVGKLLKFSSLPGINDALEGDTRLELFERGGSFDAAGSTVAVSDSD